MTWEEVQACHERGDDGCSRSSTDELLARAEDQGDLFAPVLSLKQSLPTLR